jgi:myo-inositol-1(or 4)-monophosphatase
LKVSAAATLIDSLLCTGFPYSVQTDSGNLLDLFGDFLRAARAVRRLGSAAIDMAYVAAGRLDGFWEVQLNPWDISAGALMVEEAGGRVSGLTGASFDSRSGEVVASNGRIHDHMVEIVRARSRTK